MTRRVPMLFSAPMVRALVECRKTETRRLIKDPEILAFLNGTAAAHEMAALDLPTQPNDLIWVKEAWKTDRAYDDLRPSEMGGEEPLLYVANNAVERWGWKPDPLSRWGRARSSIHMPMWASRLTLVVTGTAVERLQDITEAGAWAEGCKPGELDDNGNPFPAEEPHPKGGTIGWDCARDWYADLWDALNGPGAWDANPWVSVTRFHVVGANVAQVYTGVIE